MLTASLDAPTAAWPLDRSGLPLTTTARAAASYRAAIDRVHGAEAGAEALLDEAIAGDPDFALAHAARWMLAHADGDAATGRSALAAALRSRDGLAPWERGHVECLAALLQHAPDAQEMAHGHLAAYPGDLLVAFQLLGEIFFQGGVGKRAAALALLRGIEPHHRGDWAFTARLGFHLSEAGEPDAAVALIASALDARPQAPFVAHAMAHALLESGARAASHRFLRDWTARNDPAGPLDGHVHWHLSLGELEAAAPAVAIEHYLRATAPGASHCAIGLLVADAAGLFARMRLDDVPLDVMPREVLHPLLAGLRGALRIPFVAVHAAALAFAIDALEELERAVAVTARAQAVDDARPELRVVTAFRAYAVGDWEGCVAALEHDRASAWEGIGGSNEERALVGKLHARACARLGT